MDRSVLVVVAHPDDELLGCGGTLARHAAEGDDIHIAILAEGITSRDPTRDAGASAVAIDDLRNAAAKAAAIVGASPPHFGGLADNRLDGVELLDIIKIIEKTVREVAPDIVYTHHHGDLNVDHRIVYQAVRTAARPLPDAAIKAIYCFETLSSTEWSGSVDAAFHPTRFVDITDHLDTKLAALACYDTEVRPFPHPRSIEAVTALARVRGSTAGCYAAEAFTVAFERT